MKLFFSDASLTNPFDSHLRHNAINPRTELKKNQIFHFIKSAQQKVKKFLN